MTKSMRNNQPKKEPNLILLKKSNKMPDTILTLCQHCYLHSLRFLEFPKKTCSENFSKF